MNETRFVLDLYHDLKEDQRVTLLVGTRGKHRAERTVRVTELFLHGEAFTRAMAEAVEKAKAQIEEDLDLLELGEELLAREA